ncbi:ABC-2 transporter permease [Clostridia bacterium]|nr:ABC-2 transporter permease [Clostridia bacterium]
MFQLVYKDIAIQKKSFLIVLGYILFFVAIFQSQPNMMYSATVVATTYILAMGGFALDDQAEADTFLNSLPVTRANLVGAKYVSLMLFFLFGTVCYGVLYQLLYLLGLPIQMGSITIENLIGAVVAVSLINSIYFPILFKIGYHRAKIFNFILFFGVFSGFSLLSLKMQKSTSVGTLSKLEQFINQKPDILLAGILLAMAAILLLISFGFSLYFYKRRDF